jgi:hypothetical protein
MAGAPIQLTLYDENDEPRVTFARGFVPWRILKAAIKLQGINQEQLSDEDIDRINALVVDFFGNRFTVAELENGATLTEVFAVITAIMARLEGDLPGLGGANPTLPQMRQPQAAADQGKPAS